MGLVNCCFLSLFSLCQPPPPPLPPPRTPLPDSLLRLVLPSPPPTPPPCVACYSTRERLPFSWHTSSQSQSILSLTNPSTVDFGLTGRDPLTVLSIVPSSAPHSTSDLLAHLPFTTFSQAMALASAGTSTIPTPTSIEPPAFLPPRKDQEPPCLRPRQGKHRGCRERDELSPMEVCTLICLLAVEFFVPFNYGRFMWMHNGVIARFEKIKRLLTNSLSDEFFNIVQGNTDSEWAFALFLNQLEGDARMDTFDHVAIKKAMLKTIELINAWSKEAGITEVLTSPHLNRRRVCSVHAVHYQQDRRSRVSLLLVGNPVRILQARAL
ncbi:hypothetical protein BC938DRAFT_477721 [Jimgerdemannia flammicorona]|uniref:Uncharacterized protein n=1 Tax=Jimgerdemannia flammicorona TaxID=994334 RepID=A0A433P825_9FUNG|nr:hypothetical protein BC938DRAFT_477721 [Jimgerdemannia flammicorona]